MRSRKIEELKKRLKLTKIQREVLIGILLGDAHLETQNKGRTYRLKIEQSEKHKEYVFHLYDIFKDWVLTEPKLKTAVRYEKENKKFYFQTVSHPAFRFYAAQFYNNHRKVVPKLIHRWLTDRALAYWFADDGSVKSKESKGVIFNTQAFSLKEVKMLTSVLRKTFDLQVKERKQKEGFQIYVSGRSYEKFKSLIDPYLIHEMKYKLPTPRSNLTNCLKSNGGAQRSPQADW